MDNNKNFDAIVIGGGHAGVEAIFALAHKGFNVALISLDKNKLASMPCNPSIGGPAKGIITREVDALGGMQGILADKAMIQIKMLNESKGPAVRALRAQIDKKKYSQEVYKRITALKNITFIEDMAIELLIVEKKTEGVVLEKIGKVFSKNIILTTGTYMDSYILRGAEKYSSGPEKQRTTNKLSDSLRQNGIELQRLKTGTSPRILTSSIDFSKVEEEILDVKDYVFSHRSNLKLDAQIHCYLTYTTPETHRVIEENLHRSSMYSGAINGVGPRYCPSIEDKVIRFKDKLRHQIFFEPETTDGKLMYINGLSTSMPIDVQKKMVASIPGLKNAEIVKWAYAIEYDALNPIQLKSSLEMKNIQGLYFAGQLNGTSGYEEAAGQGLIAGINVALSLENKPSIKLTRNSSYIGVLIDDLVTKGTKEPYRMLTSRAEYRLLLRNDNADQRLTHIGYQVGLISKAENDQVINKYQEIENEKQRLAKTFLSSNSALAKKYNIFNGPSLLQVLSRPKIDFRDITTFKYASELRTQVRLQGYIIKQENEAKKMLRLENLKLPKDIDYNKVSNLASEAKEKLKIIKPETIGQAARISGINPSDIQMLMFHIEVRRRKI